MVNCTKDCPHQARFGLAIVYLGVASGLATVSFLIVGMALLVNRNADAATGVALLVAAFFGGLVVAFIFGEGNDAQKDSNETTVDNKEADPKAAIGYRTATSIQKGAPTDDHK